MAAATLFLTSSTVARPGNQFASATESVQVIDVIAQQCEINPSPIGVKQGTTVQLRITATDHTDGFSIRPSPDDTKAGAGLVFSSPQQCQKIEKSQTTTIEFVSANARSNRD
jgi:hypothetical protein